MENIIAALDLGTNKIAAIVGQKTDSGIRIVGYQEVPTEGIVRGEVVNIQKVVKSVETAINSVAQQVETPIREVWISHCCERIRHESTVIQRRRSGDDWITEEEIEDILQEARNTRVANGDIVLQAVPQSYNIDDRMGEIDPVGMIGADLEADFRLFIGKKTAVSGASMVLSRNGLSECGASLRGIASARSILTQNEMELGVALLDIGAGATDLVVIKDNIIRHLDIIPFGGNAVTEDIRQLCSIPWKTSEQLKVQYGSAFAALDNGKRVISIPGIGGAASKEIPSKELAMIIQARLSEIIKTADLAITNTGLKAELKGGLVLTGGVANTMHIQRLASQLTNMGIRVAWPENFVLAESEDKALTTTGATAVGLVLAAFDALGDNLPSYEIPTLDPNSEQGAQGVLFQTNENGQTPGTSKPAHTDPKADTKPRESWKHRLARKIGSIQEMDIFDNNNDNEA